MFAPHTRRLASRFTATTTTLRILCYSTLPKDTHDTETYFRQHHRPMTIFQKGLLAASSSVLGLFNPLKGDMVAALGETLPFTETILQRRILAKMQQSQSGREILERRPVVHENLMDMEALQRLPQNTLGFQYWHYMQQNGFLASERTPVRYIDNPELVYIMRRYREIHDFVHVVCGLANPHVLHELAVKWFEFAQTHLPMCGLSGLGGTLFSQHMSSQERRVLVNHLLPWALKQGNECEFLMSVPFETMLERDIDELRTELRLEKAPDVLALLAQEEDEEVRQNGQS